MRPNDRAHQLYLNVRAMIEIILKVIWNANVANAIARKNAAVLTIVRIR